MKTEITPLQKSLNIWAITLILWSLYRGFFKTELPIWFDELVAKPLIFIGPIYYYITKKETQDFLKAIDLKNKYWKDGLLWGILFGTIFFIVGFTTQLVRVGSYENLSLPISSLANLITLILLAFATSFSEESLSRGFILKRLFQDSKNMLSASFFTSFLYFFIRVPMLFSDPDIRGIMLIQIMATDFVFSFAVSILFLQRKNLFLPIVIHAFYIISTQLFLGLS